MEARVEKKLRQHMECIFGVCKHPVASKVCHWGKMVDLPAEKQVDYAIRIVKKTCYTEGTKVTSTVKTIKRPSSKTI